jgi:hypothetical protein
MLMETVVTTCPKRRPLLKMFQRLAGRFYPDAIRVDVARNEEKKADQLLRLCKSLGEYFILLEEDFYLIAPVDADLLHAVCDYCTANQVDRFSLQSRNHYRVSDWPVVDNLNGMAVYEPTRDVHTPFSLEASIWRRDFLRAHVRPGQSDSFIEFAGSHLVRHSTCRIRALDKPVLDYRDATIAGQQRVSVRDGVLHVMAQGGDGADVWQSLGVEV